MDVEPSHIQTHKPHPPIPKILEPAVRIIVAGDMSPFGAGYRRAFFITEKCPKCGIVRLQLGGININSNQIPWQCKQCNHPIALYSTDNDRRRCKDISGYRGSRQNTPEFKAYLAVFGNQQPSSPPLTGFNPSIIIVDDPTEPQTVQLEHSPSKPIDYFAITKSIAGG